MQPADGDARDTWRERVATVAAYRDVNGIPDEAYRLPDPGTVDRHTRHAFADAERAHEDLRRIGWMRDRDGAERNALSAVPAVADMANQTAAVSVRADDADPLGARRSGAEPDARPTVEDQPKDATPTAQQPTTAAAEVAWLAAELRAREAAAQHGGQSAVQRDAAAAEAQQRAEQIRRQQEPAERQRHQEQRRGPRL